MPTKALGTIQIQTIALQSDMNLKLLFIISFAYKVMKESPPQIKSYVNKWPMSADSCVCNKGKNREHYPVHEYIVFIK